MLLTATALSNAPQCLRKPLLSSLVRSTSDTTPALVWGSMLHEVMQHCLLEKRWDEAWIDKCIHSAISSGLGELVKLGISEQVALMEMRQRAKDFKVFAERYMGDVPKVICFCSPVIHVLGLLMHLPYWQYLNSWILKKISGHPHTVLKEN